MSDVGMTFKLFGKDVTAGKSLKDVSHEAEKTGKSLGHHIGVGSIAAGAALGGLVAGGISAAISGLGGLVSEARDAASAQRITAQVIKSTGGAAHVTAAQVDDLATAVSNKTGIDDDAVRASENLLLTFTNVRNEVGKGNDIFTRATGVIQDMSVALGQDASSSTVQLGKALNDPIKGITALQRVGVSFTESQKKQIKGLVEHGKTLEAQKLILKELGKEFGGAAAASADPMQKLGVQLSNAGKAIATLLLPALSAAAGWISSNLLPAIQQLIPWLGDHLGKALSVVGDMFDVFKEALGGGEVTTLGFLGRIGDVAYFIHDTVIPAVQSLAQGFMQNIWPAIVQVAGYIAANLQPVIEALGNFWNDTLVPNIQKLMPVLGRVAQVIGIVVGAFALAVSWIVGKVAPVFFNVLGKAIGVVVNVLVWLADRIGWVIDHFGWLQAAATTVAGWFMSNVWPKLRTFVAVVSAGFRLWWTIVSSVVGWILGRVGALVSWFTSTAWPKIHAVITLLVAGFQFWWQKARDVIGWIIGRGESLVSWFGGLKDKITGAVSGIWDGLTNGFKAALNWIIDRWNSMPSFTIGGGSFLGHDLPSMTFALPQLQHLATGTPYVMSGGYFNVGERGPEQVYLPQGSAVVPHGGMAGGDIHWHVHLDKATVIGGNRAQVGRDLLVAMDEARRGGRGGRP